MCSPFLQKTTPALPLSLTCIFMTSLPRYQKTYLLCTALTESSIFVSYLRNIFPTFLGICSVFSVHLGVFVSYFAYIVSMRSLFVQYLIHIKVPLKRKIFSRFSIVQNAWNTTAKNILTKKKFFVMFLRFKMLHFPPSSGECCSRSKGHVTGSCDVRGCVAILLW